MRILFAFATTAMTALAFFAAENSALADQKHHFTLTTPILIDLTGQVGLRSEVNLGDKASLSLEGLYRPLPEPSDSDIKPLEESITTWGREYTLLVSRYSQPTRLAGLFWTLGAGYRTQEVTWKHAYDESSGITLNQLPEGTDPRWYNQVKASGVTGHLSVGYRYVGYDFPLLASIQVGLRHYENKVEDIEGRAGATPVDAKTAISLENRLKTALTGGLVVGYAF